MQEGIDLDWRFGGGQLPLGSENKLTPSCDSFQHDLTDQQSDQCLLPVYESEKFDIRDFTGNAIQFYSGFDKKKVLTMVVIKFWIRAMPANRCSVLFP